MIEPDPSDTIRLLVSGLLVVALLGAMIAPVQGQSDATFYYGSAVAEDGQDIPAGTTIKVITEDDGKNRTVDELTMETDGEYGGSGLGDSKLEVPGTVDGPVYFVAENDLGSFTADQVVQNPNGGTQELDLTFPPGSSESRPYFTVSDLQPAETTVIEGETVDVNATIENAGSEQGTQTVSLDVGGTTVGTQDVTLGPGSTETVSFRADTGALGAGNYTHTVSTDDDSQAGDLTVEASEVTFAVSGLDPTDAAVVRGETFDASATVTNDGNAEGTETVALRAGGTTLASQEVTMAPGDQQTLTFADVGTDSLAPGTYTHGVYTGDGSQTGTLTVESRQADFTVSGLTPADETVTVGDPVSVSAAVTNDGNAEGRQTIRLRIDGEQFDSETVTLGAGDEQTISFSPVNSSQLGPGTYTYEVASENDSQTGTLVVESDNPAAFLVTGMTPTDVTVAPGGTFDIATTVENDGDRAATQQVQYRIDGDTVDRQAVTLGAGEREAVEFPDIGTGSLAAGQYTHGVYTSNDSQTGTLTIENDTSENDSQATTGFTLSELTPASTTVTKGAVVETSVTVTSEGGANGSGTVRLLVDSETVGTEPFTLDAGESTTATFTTDTDTLRAGTYVTRVSTDDDEQAGSLTITAPSDSTPTPDRSDGTPTPEPAAGTPTQSQTDTTATPDTGTTTPQETLESTRTATGTSATTDDGEDGGGGLVPSGLLRTVVIYVGLPLAAIYGILKAMAIYLGY